MDFPFSEKKISGDCVIREFNKDVNTEDLVWHMDKEDRYVTVVAGKGWKIQFDNKMPIELSEKKQYFIPKYTYHRIIKGSSSLLIEIKKVFTGEDNMNLSHNDLSRIIKEELENVLSEAEGVSALPTVGDIYVNAEDQGNKDKEVRILPNTNLKHVSFQFLGNGYADTFGFVKRQKAKMSLQRFRLNFAKKEIGIDQETGADKVEPIYTLGNRDKSMNESITREEVVWLLENCGGEKLPGKPNCGCGKDPCETYGSLDATINGNVLDVDMSSMTIAGKPDHEVEMAHKQLRKTADYAGKLQGMMDGIPETNLPAWVQAKITTASEDIGKVYHYLEEYLAGALMDTDESGSKDAMISGEITSVNERETQSE